MIITKVTWKDPTHKPSVIQSDFIGIRTQGDNFIFICPDDPDEIGQYDMPAVSKIEIIFPSEDTTRTA